jgi:hypothetical protein
MAVPSTQRSRECRARQRESSQHRDLFKAAAILVKKDNEARGRRMVLLQRVERLLTDHPRFTGRVESMLKTASAELRARPSADLRVSRT